MATATLRPFFIMSTFVVSIRLPAVFDDEFLALIPQHRGIINQLLADYIIETYAISADRNRGWITINGDNEAAVLEIVKQFPLYTYFQEVEIDELFLFDSAATRFPRISLN